MSQIDALLITGGDPWGEPTGGQTTFCKHLLKAFGPRLAITSHSNEQFPIGQWIVRKYRGQSIQFLSRGKQHQNNNKKPLIPARITSYLNAKKYMPVIYELGIRNVFTDCPELLFAISNYSWESVCFRYAGVNNPISNSRYKWLRCFGKIFEKKMMKTLKRIDPDAIIAAADNRAIDEMFERTGNVLNRSKFHQFPTRVDMEMFYPMDKETVRQELGISEKAKVLVATGRLCWIKGWDLLLESLVVLKKSIPAITLIFLGDGEDHMILEEKAKQLGVYDNILITGFIPQQKVVKYLNAADVCVVGSHREGWSLAMCEIIACGQAVVSTDVSGARDIVHDGKNGFVVKVREPEVYADAIINAMQLENTKDYSIRLAQKYSVSNLANDLGAIWAPLS